MYKYTEIAKIAPSELYLSVFASASSNDIRIDNDSKFH